MRIAKWACCRRPFNYLLRLGWSHGDEEILPAAKAVEWFDLEHISANPARFDMDKLKSINSHYMRALPDAELLAALRPFLPADAPDALARMLPALKERAQTLVELAAAAAFIFARPALDEKAAKTLDDTGKSHLKAMLPKLEAAEWNGASLEALIKAYLANPGRNSRLCRHAAAGGAYRHDQCPRRA